MVFNLNEFLIAVSIALDFVEMDIFGIATNHSKRVAYISMRIAEKLGLSREETFDAVSLAILHDNGASEKLFHDRYSGRKMNLHSIESMQEHCLVGEENIRTYPFLTDVRDVIKFHHENYDGTGFFRKTGVNIPILSQIIRLADSIDLSSHLNRIHIEDKESIRNYVKEHENTWYSPKLAEVFLELSYTQYFWLDMKDEFIDASLQRNMPGFSREIPLSRMHEITKVFSKIIDSKSRFTQVHSRELSGRIAVLGGYYRKPAEEIERLVIAADLHDVGKLAVTNEILDKPGPLDEREFDVIRQHPYYTRLSLQGIRGFEDITEWASNHHEKLSGKGYPYGRTAQELDYNSRLLASLDVFQALMEERPYRSAMSAAQAVSVLNAMVEDGSLDKKITSDIIRVFVE